MTPEQAAAVFAESIGVDVSHPDLQDTPARMVRAFQELTAGRFEDPGKILAKTFEADYDQVVVLRDIAFTSLCEHHLLVVTGVAHVGYLPGKRVVGLSKLARLVDCFARRPQIQERMTRQIAEALLEHLQALGAGVIVAARHECMACRGARQPGATMVTSCMLGVFRTEREARAEFLSLVGR